MYHFIRFLLLLIASLPLLAQDGEIGELAGKLREQIARSQRKIIAVVEISNTENYSEAFSNYLTDELSIRLVQDSPGFRLVTRTRLTQLAREKGLKYAEGFDPVSFKQLGQFAGTDTVITGSFKC